MRTTAVLAGVAIPVVGREFHTTGLNLSREFSIAFFTYRTADNLADTGEQYVCALHGLAVSVLLHIEGLDLTRIIVHDNRFLEIFLYKETLVLTAQVHTPLGDRELKLMTFLHCVLQNTETFGIWQTDEFVFYNRFQGLYETVVYHLVEELQIVTAIVERPSHTILDEVFFKVHQSFLIKEGYFGLHHPELSQMTGRVAVLGTERRTEGVNSTEGRSSQFAFQLSTDGKIGLLTEEILVVLYFSFLCHSVQVECGDLEHLTGSLSITGCDKGGVEIIESVLVEIGMYGHRHVMTDAEHSPKSVGTQTEVGMLAQELHRVSFLLQGIIGTARTEYFDVGTLYLHCLTGTLALYQITVDTDTCSCGDVFDYILVELFYVDYNLYILYCRTIVKSDEIDCFAATAGTHPPFYVYN